MPRKPCRNYKVTTYEGFGPKKVVGYYTQKEFKEWLEMHEDDPIEYQVTKIKKCKKSR